MCLLLGATSVFALSRQDARVAKERMSRCQFNDAVCAGNVLIDAMVASGNNQDGTRPPRYSQEKAVTVYQFNNCTGAVQRTVIVKEGQLQDAINSCTAGDASFSNSYAIDGKCEEGSSFGPSSSICTTAVIKANTQF